MAYGIKTTHTDLRKTGLFKSLAPTQSVRPVTREDSKTKKTMDSIDRVLEIQRKEAAAEERRKNAEIVDKAVGEAIRYKK